MVQKKSEAAALTIAQFISILNKYQDAPFREIQFTVQGVVIEVKAIKSEDRWTISGADEDGPIFDDSRRLVIELQSDDGTNQHIEASQHIQALMAEHNRVSNLNRELQSENLKLRQEMELIFLP
jgi:hypothetical protein